MKKANQVYTIDKIDKYGKAEMKFKDLSKVGFNEKESLGDVIKDLKSDIASLKKENELFRKILAHVVKGVGGIE